MMVAMVSASNAPEEWEALVAASVDGIIVIDGDGIVRFANPAARGMFSDQVADLVGSHLGVPAIREPVPLILPQGGDIVFVELRACEITWHGESATLATLRDVTRRQQAEDALKESLAERDRLLDIADRTRLAQLSVLEDQKEATDALRESVRFVRSTLDSLRSNIALVDERGEILFVNQAWRDFAEANGGSAASVSEGANYLQVCASAGGPEQEEAQRFADGIRRVLDGLEREYRLEYACDGLSESRWFVGRVTPFSGGGPRRVVVSHEDVTERRRGENRVRHLNRVLHSIREVNQLVERKSDADILIHEVCHLLVDRGSYDFAMIVVTDPAGRPTAWAEAGSGTTACGAQHRLGSGDLPPCCLEAAGTAGPILIGEADGRWGSCSLADRSHGGAVLSMRLTHAEASYGFLVVSLSQDGGLDEEERDLFVTLAADLGAALDANADRAALARAEEAKESIQRQLLQAQKMEAVGRLAGGVAHDYNNMLSVILGHASLALQEVDQQDPLREDLEQIVQAADRSAGITRQLLAFARQQTAAPRVISLNLAVGNTLSMLGRLIGEDIALQWSPDDGIPPVTIDPVQLDQVLTNLCVNSRDAISGVGCITIETGSVTLDESAFADVSRSAPGRYVCLTVRDDGAGMTPDTLEHLFEPFFTTKETGKGTGLGMSTVYGIVEQNGGFVEVTSQVGRGTSVSIFLPASQDPVFEVTAPLSALPSSGGGESILIVEDEVALLQVARRLLDRVGYHVLTASTPAAAIALGHDHEEKIDLVITDVVMPEMNGRDLIAVLRTIRPGVRCLFMSGHTADIVGQRGVLDKEMNFIEKPFEVQAFTAKVRAVLDSPPEG